MAINLSRELRNYDLLIEVDLSGSSFSKQFKRANKLKAKSIIIIGDEEAQKKEFIIRLFNNEVHTNNEASILFEDKENLEKWINTNLFFKNSKSS